MLAALALTFAIHTAVLAGKDSCTYVGQTSGCAATTSSSKTPNWADSMFITADLLNYGHVCWTEYCHGMAPPLYRNLGSPTDSTACTNRCENCCLYEINIENLRWFAKINHIDLCTDRGCYDTLWRPMSRCDSLWGWDHICEYCPTATKVYNGTGWVPVVWDEDSTCPRLLPKNGAATLADGWKDSLCRSNCLHAHAMNAGDKPGFLDTLQFRIGFTGDCLGRTRETQGGGSYRGKCIWICITWDDGVQACCQIRVPHCTCTGNPECYPPCNQDTCSGSVGPFSPIPPAPPPGGGDELSQKGAKRKGGAPLVKARKPETEVPGGTHMKDRR